jgi:hypothetical protein
MTGDGITPQAPASLAVEYIIPPFTVLDSRQGYWLERKQRWITWGLTGEAGRDASAYQWHMGGDNGASWKEADGSHTTVSTFDPVLCEIIYQWFSPAAGTVIDPFAGGVTRGAIAAKLGHTYYGIELRAEQVEANTRQASDLGVTPTWITGDSHDLDMLLTADVRADLIFTCPPYYDLEVYSGDVRDGSAFATYPRFLAWYTEIFAQAIARLHDDRFIILVVGDVRDPRGIYRGLIHDTVAVMRTLGVGLYNEAIYITPVGSLAMRTRKQFDTSRKLGRGHQQVLMFVKGDPRRATAAMGAVDPDAVASPQLGLFDLAATVAYPAENIPAHNGRPDPPEYVQVQGDDTDEEDWL